MRVLRQVFADYRRQAFRRSDTQLLVDVESAENDFDGVGAHPEFSRQKPDHMIGRPSRNRRSRDTHPELIPFGLANRIPIGTRRSQNIKDQRSTIPCTKAIVC